MTKLTYSGEIREESDESVIQTLVRKGWAIIPEPEPMPAYPVFDRTTHKATYNANTNSYTITELTAEEIQTQIEAEANMQAAMQRAAVRQLIVDQIDAGYDVQPEDFILGFSEADRNAFTQMTLLVREAITFHLIDLETPQVIKDVNGTPHTMTTERYLNIIIAYGLRYKQLWDNLTQ
jgi:hypothetical protein